MAKKLTRQQRKFKTAATKARTECLADIQGSKGKKSSLRGRFNRCLRREMKKAL